MTDYEKKVWYQGELELLERDFNLRKIGFEEYIRERSILILRLQNIAERENKHKSKNY